MPTETVYCDGVTFSLTNLTGACSDISDDTSTTASDSDFLAATDADEPTELTQSFTNPSGNLQNNQVFKARLRCTKNATQSVSYTISDSGGTVASGSVRVTNSDPNWTEYTIATVSAASFNDASGASVQITLSGGTAGGPPAGRWAWEVSALQWDVDYTTAVTHTYTGVSGGVELSGAATTARTFAYPASGSVALSGAAAHSRTFVYTVSGGIDLSGAAATSYEEPPYVPTGGISLSGAAATARTFAYVPTGGIATSGAATTSYVSGASGGTITAVANAESGTWSSGDSKLTFSSLSFGAADSNRVLIAAVTRERGDCTAVTIGGVTATIVEDKDSATVAWSTIAVAEVPTGTSGDVVLTLSADSQLESITLYRSTDISATAEDSSSDSQISSTELSAPDLNVSAGSVVVGASFLRADGTPVWDTMTADYTGLIGGREYSHASDEVAAADSTYACDLTWSANTNKSVVAAAFPYASGTTTYTYTGVSGGVSLTGAATKSKTKAYPPSGGVSFTGAATTSWDQEFIYAASGGATLSGAATTSWDREFVYAASGGVALAGAAAHSLTKAYTASGGVVLSGAATASWDREFVYAPSGGVDLSGAATTSFSLTYTYLPSGGVDLSGAASASFDKEWVYAPTGGVELSGAANTSRTITYQPSGGISLAGTANHSLTKVYSASGGVELSGAATTFLSTGNEYLPSGGVSLSGAATYSVELDFPYSPTGGVSLSGAATSSVELDFTYSSTGGVSLSGAATSSVELDFTYSPSGGVALSGTAPSFFDKEWVYSPSGGVLLSGAAATEYVLGSQEYPYTGAGTLTLGGSASPAIRTYAHTASGGVGLSGAATTEYASAATVFEYTGAGALSLSGSAERSRTFARETSGGVALGGSAATSTTSIYEYLPSGGVALSGAASTQKGYGKAYTASGGVVLTGAASVVSSFQFSYDPSGGISLSGAAQKQKSLSWIPVGGVSFSGSADALTTADMTPGDIDSGTAGTVVVGSMETPDSKVVPLHINKYPHYYGKGGISFSGSVTTGRRISYIGTGGFNLVHFHIRGVRTWAKVPSGGPALAGAATTEYQAA